MAEITTVHSMICRLTTTCVLVICLLASGPLLATDKAGRDSIDPEELKELAGTLKDAANDTAEYFNNEYDAQVWMVAMSNRLEKFMPDEEERIHLLRTVIRESRRTHLRPEIVMSVIEVESHFQRYAISSVGAQGLMQVMPFWKDEIGRPDDNLTKVDTNLRYGCTILKFYLDKERGNIRRALARYNGSLGKTWYPRLVENAWDRRWRSGSI